MIPLETDLQRLQQRLQSLERENAHLRQHETDVRTLRQELETAYRERLALIAETKVAAAEKLDAQRERHQIATAHRELSRAKEAMEQELRIILGPEASSAVIGGAGRPASAVYKTELEKIREHAQELEERSARLQSEFNEHIAQLQSELEHCRTALSQIVASSSWKLTKPLRMLTQLIRRVRT